jgi:galactonate dehydratase
VPVCELCVRARKVLAPEVVLGIDWPHRPSVAVPYFAWLEVRVGEADDCLAEDDPDLFTRRPRLDGVVYRFDDAPGLGIEIDEALLDAGDFRFWEAPHWKRRDGSVTNW